MAPDHSTDLLAYIRGELVGADVAIDESTSLFSSKIVSSRNLMHLVTHLEKQYGIKVKPMELILENFDSVHKIAAYLAKKQR